MSTYKVLAPLRAFLFAMLLCAIAYYAGQWLCFPSALSQNISELAAMEWQDQSLSLTDSNFKMFRKIEGDKSEAHGPLAKKYKLAGTFIAFGAHQQSRKAVIDILANGSQELLSEGELLEESVRIKSVFRDRVILLQGNHEEEILLSFTEIELGMKSADGTQVRQLDEQDSRLLARFGKRIGEKRWVLSRDSVLDYYQELFNDGERLAKVFASMKPVYERDSIQGYVLDVEGEGDFFNAFGLKQGDIVRKVNSMPMTNRGRAEYFIKEFVADKANAFVLDIERDGRPDKLIYMTR